MSMRDPVNPGTTFLMDLTPTFADKFLTVLDSARYMWRCRVVFPSRTRSNSPQAKKSGRFVTGLKKNQPKNAERGEIVRPLGVCVKSAARLPPRAAASKHPCKRRKYSVQEPTI